MKRKIGFVLAAFAATVVMALQNACFHGVVCRGGFSAGVGGWLAVLGHGLSLDLTVAGYVTAPAAARDAPQRCGCAFRNGSGGES